MCIEQTAPEPPFWSVNHRMSDQNLAAKDLRYLPLSELDPELLFHVLYYSCRVPS